MICLIRGQLLFYQSEMIKATAFWFFFNFYKGFCLKTMVSHLIKLCTVDYNVWSQMPCAWTISFNKLKNQELSGLLLSFYSLVYCSLFEEMTKNLFCPQKFIEELYFLRVRRISWPFDIRLLRVQHQGSSESYVF